jgi:hypothetical protein
MVKLHGKRRWRKSGHRSGVFDEVMALEIMLDSLHQKALKHSISYLSDYEIELSKMLGMARSALAHLKSGQRTLKRYIRPAPNQKEAR